MNRIGIGVLFLLVLVICLTAFRSPHSEAQQNVTSAVPKLKVGRIEIDTHVIPENDSVTLTLLHNGKVVAMSDYRGQIYDSWVDLEPGDYEVRCEAVGKQTLVKRLHLF